jgi:hypothetical protein
VDNALDLTSIQVVGTPANGSVAVNGDGTVTYTHDGSETTGDAFTYTIRDTSGATSDISTVTIAVTPVNDLPVLSNNSLTIAEGETVVLSDADLLALDADGGSGSLTLEVVSVSGGGFERAGQPGTPITSFTQAELDAGAVRFVHDGSELAPTYTLTVSDGFGQSGPEAADVTFSNVNDLPSLVANEGAAVVPGGSHVISTQELCIEDPDHATADLRYVVTTQPEVGYLALADASDQPVSTFTQADIDGGRLIYVHGGSSATSDRFEFGITDGVEPIASTASFDLHVAFPTFQAPTPLFTDPVDTTPESQSEPEPESQPAADEDEQAVREGDTDTDPDDDLSVSDGVATGPEAGGPLPFEWAPQSATENRSDFEVSGSLAGPVDAIDGGVDLAQTWVEKSAVHSDVEAIEVEDESHRWIGWQDGTLWAALDTVRHDLTEEQEERLRAEEWSVETIEATAMVLSTSILPALLRSSSLWAATLSSIPLWRRADPLVVLALSDEERRKMQTELREAREEEERLSRVLDRRGT